MKRRIKTGNMDLHSDPRFQAYKVQYPLKEEWEILAMISFEIKKEAYEDLSVYSKKSYKLKKALNSYAKKTGMSTGIAYSKFYRKFGEMEKENFFLSACGYGSVMLYLYHRGLLDKFADFVSDEVSKET